MREQSQIKIVVSIKLDMKIHNFIIATSLIILSACAQSQQVGEENVKHVTAAEFMTAIKSGAGQLVDIRTPGEFNMGHIEGAIMVDFYAQDFKTNLNRLEKDVPIYIYCRSGNRTSKSVRLLQDLGFNEIINLRSGLIDWQRAGFTLLKG